MLLQFVEPVVGPEVLRPSEEDFILLRPLPYDPVPWDGGELGRRALREAGELVSTQQPRVLRPLNWGMADLAPRTYLDSELEQTPLLGLQHEKLCRQGLFAFHVTFKGQIHQVGLYLPRTSKSLLRAVNYGIVLESHRASCNNLRSTPQLRPFRSSWQ